MILPVGAGAAPDCPTTFRRLLPPRPTRSTWGRAALWQRRAVFFSFRPRSGRRELRCYGGLAVVTVPRLRPYWLRLGRLARDATSRVGAVEAISEFWMGYALPPARRAIDASAWTPDRPQVYCPRCGGSVGPGETGADGCSACRERAAPVDRVVRLGSYAGPLREWVLAIKYRERWTEMAEELGRLLAIEIARAGAVERERAVVVPMPMPWMRRLDRGIDHARSIAAGVARGLGADVVAPLAKRNGPPQATLARAERARCGRRGLALRRGWRATGGVGPLAGLDIVLVDDVATTGASIGAAAGLLRRLGPRRVVAAVLAVSDERARRDRQAEQDVPERPGGAPLRILSRLTMRSG